MYNNCQYKGDCVKIIVRECVRLFIVTEVERFSFSHEVHCVASQSYKNDLHDEEVEALPYED